MPRLEQVSAGFQRAKRLRRPFEPLYQDCYDYAMPGRRGFYGESTARSHPEIFDETAVVATAEFASRIQQGLTPNFSRWAVLSAGSQVGEDQKQEVDIALDRATQEIFADIDASRFASEASEAFLDLAVGTAAFDVTNGDALRPVQFEAIPLPELYIEAGPGNTVDRVYRARTVLVRDLPVLFPGASVPSDLEQKAKQRGGGDAGDPASVLVVQAEWRNREKPNEYLYDYCVFLPEHELVIHKRAYQGLGSQRFHVFRWSKATGDVWGRGPLLNCLPAIRTANLTVQLILENAEMAVAGIYTAEDDGVVNTENVRLVPGTVIPVAPGSNGLRPVEAAGRFDVSQLILGEMRDNIRRSLFNENLGPTDTTPMSATEVQQRMADLARQIGSAFGRLQSEFVTPVIQRVVYLAREAGRIAMPTVDGKTVAVRSTSPLAQAQAIEDINALSSHMALVRDMFGPQQVQLLFHGDRTMEYLADKFGTPPDLKRTPAEQQELAQQVQQLMANNQGEPPQ